MMKEVIPFSRIRGFARRRGWEEPTAEDLVFLSFEAVEAVVSLSKEQNIERGGVLLGYMKRADGRILYQLREFFEMENVAKDKERHFRASRESISEAEKLLDGYNVFARIHTHIGKTLPSPEDLKGLRHFEELASPDFVVTISDGGALIACSYRRFFLLLSNIAAEHSATIEEWIPPFVYPGGVDLWRGKIRRYARDYGYDYERIEIAGIPLQELS